MTVVLTSKKPLTREAVRDAYAEACYRLDRSGSLDASVKRLMVEILGCEPHELEGILSVEEFCIDLVTLG